MAATPSVKITKSAPWRATTKLWTNRYHFTAGVPASNAAWLAFFDAIVLAEKAALFPNATITKAEGYAAGSNLPAASKTYTTVGTLTNAGLLQERQVAALVRYATDAVTSRNHPVYLFNYYHGASADSAHTDQVTPTEITALTNYAAAWISGFSDGTTTHKRAGPNGAVALTGACELYLTHRDFPR
jgi:hypothetical protein